MQKQDLSKSLKNISAKDRKQIEDAQEMLGPDPDRMGVIKNMCWGRIREDLILPYPEITADETVRCNQLLKELDTYLKNEHPHHQIDTEQEIPTWVIKRLFDIGTMGMIIPQEYGGGGFSITSYNRVLERIGYSCGSTAVMVSAHQSIGCGAIKLFGTDEQKREFLPALATNLVSAFCLSEPNVGCDAGGQETRCEVSEDGEYYILNGEKKWATSGALAGLLTVMCKQSLVDPKTGKPKDCVTALICTPEMEGIEISSCNRSKCGIRGTWQARVLFKDVKVPRANLLHKEGRGLNVALTCLNYGRCTLSAGMVGAAQAAFQQSTKWAQYRNQFDRPLADFDQVQSKIATMAAYCYALDAMLYMTTGIVDRGDDDIMIETAICKVFCSDIGWKVTNEALQIMGGEGFMTENIVERLWRDSRINMVVEGANEVMHTFIFAYGSKQLGEYLLGIKAQPFSHLVPATKITAELYFGVKARAPRFENLHPSLQPYGELLSKTIRDISHAIKMSFKRHAEGLITNQMIQARLSWSIIWAYAISCSISKLDNSIRKGLSGAELEHDRVLVGHICAFGIDEINANIRALTNNHDNTMRKAAAVSLKYISSLPNADYVMPESTPDPAALGKGRVPDQTAVPQFGSGSLFGTETKVRQ